MEAWKTIYISFHHFAQNMEIQLFEHQLKSNWGCLDLGISLYNCMDIVHRKWLPLLIKSSKQQTTEFGMFALVVGFMDLLCWTIVAMLWHYLDLVGQPVVIYYTTGFQTWIWKLRILTLQVVRSRRLWFWRPHKMQSLYIKIFRGMLSDSMEWGTTSWILLARTFSFTITRNSDTKGCWRRGWY